MNAGHTKHAQQAPADYLMRLLPVVDPRARVSQGRGEPVSRLKVLTPERNQLGVFDQAAECISTGLASFIGRGERKTSIGIPRIQLDRSLIQLDRLGNLAVDLRLFAVLQRRD